MPELGLPKVASRLNTTDQVKARYWTYAHLPTLHDRGMNRQLIDYGHEAPRLKPSVGSIISDLFRRRWRIPNWRPMQPLHAILAEAVEADKALARDSAEKKRLAEQASADAGFFEMDPEIPTNLERQARPGVQILLARRKKTRTPQADEAPALDPVAPEADGTDHHSPPLDGEGPPNGADSDAPETSRAVMEQPRAAVIVQDIGATIYSRTYGIAGPAPSFKKRDIIPPP